MRLGGLEENAAGTKTNAKRGGEQRKGIVVEPGSIPTLIKFRPASRLAAPVPRGSPVRVRR